MVARGKLKPSEMKPEDFQLSCLSCEDGNNVCEHIAEVYQRLKHEWARSALREAYRKALLTKRQHRAESRGP